MKKNIIKNKKSYLLIAILTILACSSFMAFGKATFTFNIDQFKENVQTSPDEWWKSPAQNRKNAVSNKLTELQQLITEENFEEAYDKLLYDIKPKLTGLKQDEHGEPWGNGVFEKAWVTCDELQVSFEEECNLILSQINPFSVYDDDKTSPSISFQYEGEGNIFNPGVWHVDIEDLESGLDTVVITVNDIEEVYDLQGESSVSYDVPVPAIAQINMIEVTATNNDKDYEGDQETGTESDWVEIFEDINPPVINHPADIQYEFDSTGNNIVWIATDDHPDIYTVFLDGQVPNSGMWESGNPIVVDVDGLSLGTHEFTIFVDDSYDNIAIDTVLVTVIEDDDDTPPTIVIHYSGGNSELNPGIWIVIIEDPESGIDEVHVLVDGDEVIYDFSGEVFIWLEVNVPGIEGTHTIEVTAINNDKDYVDDQESWTESAEILIIYVPPIFLP